MTFDAAAAAEEAVTMGRPHRLIHWPGDPSKPLALVVLSEDELADATVKGARFLREGLKLDAIDLALTESDGLMARAKECFLLAAALRRPEAPEVPAFDAVALRKSITERERKALMAMYREYELERAALTGSEDPEQVLNEVIALGKDEDRWTFVMCCDEGTLRSTAICMLRRLLPPTNDSSSGT